MKYRITGVGFCIAIGFLTGCVGTIKNVTDDNPVEVKRMVIEIPDLKVAIAKAKTQVEAGVITMSEISRKDSIVASAILDEILELKSDYDYMQSEFISRFLWTHFIPDSDSRGSFVVTEDWKTQWDSFSQSLVKKAKAQGLDDKSLKKSLSNVTATFGQSAHLPLIATFIEDPATGKTYWAIFAVWEYASLTGHDMGHVRVWLIDTKTLDIVAEARCG